MVLLRDNPQHAEMKGNDIAVTNGTLGKVELGGSSGFVEFSNNTLHNCYAAQNNSAAGNVTDRVSADTPSRSTSTPAARSSTLSASCAGTANTTPLSS